MNKRDRKALVDLNMAIALCGAEIALGGPGSGNWAHVGRPGKRGGSASRSGGMSIARGRDWQQRQSAARGGGGEKTEAQKKRDGILSNLDIKREELANLKNSRQQLIRSLLSEKDENKNNALKSELKKVALQEMALGRDIKAMESELAEIEAQIKKENFSAPPLSGAVNIYDGDKYADVYKDTLQVIDGVHGDGVLEKIDIDTVGFTSYMGAYSTNFEGDYSSISINPDGTHKSETLSHEVGHWIDHRALGDGEQFLSESYGLGERTPEKTAMSNIMRVMANSESIKKLGQAVDDPGSFSVTISSDDGNSYSVTPSEGILNYYLSSSEMWARAYSQYIATRSGNSNMLAAINAQVSAKDYTQYSQWTTEDFEPIAEAIDELMEVKGWLR